MIKTDDRHMCPPPSTAVMTSTTNDSNKDLSAFRERMHWKTPAEHHGGLMLRLYNSIGEENFHVMKHALLAKGCLTVVQAEKMNNFASLWNTLSANGVVSIGSYEALKAILTDLKLIALVQIIEEEEEAISEWMESVGREADHCARNFDVLDLSFPSAARFQEVDCSAEMLEIPRRSLSESKLDSPPMTSGVSDIAKRGKLCSTCAKDGMYTWAACFCEGCEGFVCGACSEQHHSKGHIVRLIATGHLERAGLKCGEQGHGRQDTYCKDCDVLFCVGFEQVAHEGHECCTFSQAVTRVCKDVLETQKFGRKVLRKMCDQEDEEKAARESRRLQAEALKFEIEKRTSSLIKSITENKEGLLQEINTFVKNQDVSDAGRAAKQRLKCSLEIGGQIMSSAITSAEELKFLKNALRHMQSASGNFYNAQNVETAETFPKFVETTGQSWASKLGFLKPFSRATMVDDFTPVTISNRTCFIYSVAILPDGRCAVLGASKPDGAAPRTLFIYAKNGLSHHRISRGVGLAVDMTCRDGELVVLRKEKPYVSFYSPDGNCKTLAIEGDLVDPWSITTDKTGRIVISHGEKCAKLALIYHEGQMKHLLKMKSPRSVGKRRPMAGDQKGESTTKTTAYHETAHAAIAVMQPCAGVNLGPGRLCWGKEIYSGFDEKIVRYAVNENEIVQTRSGDIDEEDLIIHGISVSGDDVYVIGEIWEDILVWEVAEAVDGLDGWQLRHIPLYDSSGPMKLTGSSNVCFDILDNMMLIGYTDTDDRGHIDRFKLGPV